MPKLYSRLLGKQVSHSVSKQCLSFLIFLVGASTAIHPGNVFGQIKLPGGVTIAVPRSNPSQTRIPGLNGRPQVAKTCPAIVNWMQELANEYPSFNFQSSMEDRVETMAIPLFADSAFQPVFGKPYSKLSDADMQSILRDKLHPCAASQYRSQMILVVEADYAFIPKLTMHPLSPSRLASSLEALAQARTSLAATEASLSGLPASAETYDKLKGIARDESSDLKLVLPSERAAFNKLLGDAVTRSAQPALEGKLTTLIAGAGTYDGLQALRQAPQAYPDLFAAVSPEYRTQAQHQIDARYSQGMQKLLVAQRTESQRFPGDRTGMAESAVWYRSFQIKFLRNSPSPEAQAISSEFLKKREAQLGKLIPELRKAIHQAKNEEDMNAVISSIFLLSEDRQTASYDQLKKYISDQATLALRQAPDTPLEEEAPSSRHSSRGIGPSRTAASQDDTSAGGNGALQIGTKYLTPELVDNVYTGHLDAVPIGEPYAKLYLYNMADNIAETCEAYFTKAELSKLSLDAVMKSQDMSQAGMAATGTGMLMNLAQLLTSPANGLQRASASAQDQDELEMNAMKDAFVLMKRHTCGTPELDRFTKNVVAFIENEGAPLRGVDEISFQCQREHSDVSAKQSSNDCNCFVGAMTQAPVTRAERKTLADNVWENAQKIMQAHPSDFQLCSKRATR